MAARKLAAKAVKSNPAGNGQTAAAAVDKVEYSAAAIEAAARALAKVQRRDDLTSGGSYKVDYMLTARVNDGPIFRQAATVQMTVGREVTRAASVAAPLDELIGLMLEQMNETHRAAILRKLPELFAANGNKLPAVSKETTEAVAAMLHLMRTSQGKTVRGNVSITPQATAPPLSVFNG